MVSGITTKCRPGPRIRSALLGRIKGFRGDEAGAMIVFSLIIFMLMIMAAGLAVDVMIMENKRVRIQQTVDRAVLAAADLQQTQSPTAVVEEYFDKAGLSEYLQDVKVKDFPTHRRVEAITSAQVETHFLHLLGIRTLTAPGAGVAEEGVSDIEVSLVLDVSGSMGNNSRLTNLKTAAKAFVTQVLTQQTAGITSISIVPYNETVNAGATLLSNLNTHDWHTTSHCIRFRNPDFDTISMDPTVPMERVGHYNKGYGGMAVPTANAGLCDNRARHEILTHSTSVTDLHAHIDGLRAGGWTAIDHGMKWGVALIDPSLRTAITNMVAQNGNPGLDVAVAGRPAEYSDTNTMKVIILMTDGANTEKHDLKDAFKTPDTLGPQYAFIYHSATLADGEHDKGWLVHNPDAPANKRWFRPGDRYKPYESSFIADGSEPNDLVQVTYQDIYHHFWTRDAADYFYAFSDPSGSWTDYGGGNWGYSGTPPQIYYDMRNPVTLHDAYSEADTRLKALCDKIHLKKSVRVFTIGFEAPTQGEAVMKYCASSSGDYYDVKGTDITTAFKSIASQINHLRLTQ